MFEAVLERISEHKNTQSAISLFSLYNNKKTSILSCYALENIDTKLSEGNHFAKWHEDILLIDGEIYFGNFCNGTISKNCISLGDTLDGNGFIYDNNRTLDKFFNLIGKENLNIIVKDLL